MDREVRRIRIDRLSSQNNTFDEIVFRDGVNLILGEKYDESTSHGKKTNGVGKSMSIEFLDFGFLCDYERSRISKIPEGVFGMDEEVILDLTIGREPVSIRRSRKEQDRPVIIRDGKRTQFNKLQDARDYLTGLVFEKMNGVEVPSFRSLISLLIRDERSEFADILKCYDLSRRIPADLSPHLFLLGISLENYKKVLDTIKDIERTKTILGNAKKELTQNGEKKIADVKAELNDLESELSRLEEAMEAFKSNDAFASMESEIVDLENMMEQLRQRQKILKFEFQRIKGLPKPEQIDDSEIELVYNQFKSNLGSAVVRSLNEVVSFKNKVEEFQNVLVNRKARELESQIDEISKQLRVLDEQYAEKIRIIDKKGVLKNLKTGLRIYEAKHDALSHMQFLFDQYDQYDKQKKHLGVEKGQELLEIDNAIESLSTELKSFTTTILDIHETIMDNRECSFEIKTRGDNSKIPLDISLRIYDDGSHSVDRTKVFIYDMALMFNEYTSKRHPLFLVHDNIFDVDQDTLVQCLNYLYKQEEYYPEFQYILTLNRDKIENEERRKQIKMDIDAHRIAVYTKGSKFLKQDYQEK